jgi:WD40 repeat protein
VEILDPETGESLHRLDERSASVLDLDSAGDRLVSGGLDGSAHVWDTETGRVVAELANRGAAVASASFVPGDARVVTTGRGGATVWSAVSGLALTSIAGDGEDAAVTGEGEIVIARSGGNALEVHECEVCTADSDELLQLARERIIREPTADEAALYGL